MSSPNNNNNNNNDDDGTLLLDRFISASTVSDAVDSLEALSKLSGSVLSALFLDFEGEEDQPPLKALLQILADGSFSNFSKLEGGQTLVCQIFSKLVTSESKAVFQKVGKEDLEWFIQALLDVATAKTNDISSYTRVLALEILETLCTSSPQKMQQLLLQVPNGLHQLSELLLSSDDDDNTVVVRNQALLLLTQIAKTSSSCAKILVFADVPLRCMELVTQEGGLTAGNFVVQDCLQLFLLLLKQDPESSANLILETPQVVQQLIPLLDLRLGLEYQNPSLIGKSKTKNEQEVPSTTKVDDKSIADNDTDDDDDDDDLDSILKSASSKTQTTTTTTKSLSESTAKETSPSSPQQQQQPLLIPTLTLEEELVLDFVFSILQLLTSTPAHIDLMISKYPPIPALVWELALVSPPPPSQKAPCAMPSPSIQQKALQLIGQHFNVEDIMNQHNGIDRLLYIICTGLGGSSSSPQKQTTKMALSQSALHVLRQTLGSDRAHLLVLHTLAPPLMEENTDNAPPPTTEVQKLINTLVENVPLLEGADDSAQDIGPIGLELRAQRCMNVVGALGALSIFGSQDDMTREMMLKIIPMDLLLMDLEHQEIPIQYSILKFLGDWICCAVDKKDDNKEKDKGSSSSSNVTQRVIQLVLSSTYSTSLSVVFHTSPHVSAMAGLVLGLCMDGMAADLSKEEEEDETMFGGWSPQGILEMITSYKNPGGKSRRKGSGISGYTAALESLKVSQQQQRNNQDDNNSQTMMPWSACHLEEERFQSWAKRMVHIVRKRVVQEMSGGNGTNEKDKDDGDDSSSGGEEEESTAHMEDNPRKKKEYKSLRRLVSQQSQELDELRDTLQSAQDQSQTLQTQVELWKRRAEANPTQLDELLTETQSQNQDYQKQIVDLTQTLSENETNQSNILKEHQTQLAQLEKELESSKQEQLTSRQEYCTIREEMQALSTAYSNLETQYNAATAAAAGYQQSQGEPTSSGTSGGGGGEGSTSSTEIEMETLRTENARLRQEAVSADEWMTMAVQRMNDMAGQNTTLQQEVTTLQQQQQSAADPMATTTATTPHNTAAPQEREVELESELAHVKQNVELTLESLNKSNMEKEELTKKCNHVQVELDSAQAQVVALQDSYRQLKEHQQEMEQQQLSAVTAETTASEERKSVLSQTVSSKEQEIVALKQEMETLRQNANNSAVNEGEVSSLRESVKSLQTELDMAKNQIEETMKRAGEEKRSYDTTMLELESQLAQVKNTQQASSDTDGGGATAPADMEGLQARDDEIKNLTAANDAAQEWMAKAVEHHQLLSEQLAALQNDKSSLVKQIEDLQQKNAGAAASASNNNNSNNESPSRAPLVANIKMLEDQAAENLREGHQMQERLTTVQLEFEAQQEELKRMKQASGGDKDKVETLTAKVQELEEDLSENAKESKYYKDKLETVQLEFQAQQDELRMKRENAEESRKTLAEEVNRLKVELQMKEGDLQGVRDQVNVAQQSQQDGSVWAQEELSRANEEVSRLREELQLAQSSTSLVQDKQSAFDEMQRRLFDLETTATQQTQEREDLTTEINTVRSELEFKTAQATQLEGEKGQLEAANREHVAKIENIQVAYKNLEARSKAMEQNERVLEKQIEDLREQSSTSDDLLKDKDGALIKLEETLREKEQELEEIQSQSEDVVRQWQDRASELEATTKDLEAELEEQKIEADNIISQWEQRYNEVESAAEEGLAVQLEELKEELRDKNAAVAAAEEAAEAARREREQIEQNGTDVVQQWTERASELETTVKDLQEELEQSKKDATDIISQWESQYNEVVEEKDVLETLGKDTADALVAVEDALSMAQKELEDTHKESENVVQQWTERVDELQATTKELEEDLEKQQEEASDIISQWETRYNEVVDSKSTLESELKKREEALEQDEQALTIAQKEFEALQTESENVIGQWKKRAEEFESTVKDLEKDLGEQEEEAQEAISKWETRSSTLDEKIATLESEVDESTKKREDLTRKLEESYKKLEDTTQEVNSMKTEIKSKEEQVATLKAEVDSKIREMKSSKSDFIAETELLSRTHKSLESDLGNEKELVASCEKEIESLKEELAEMREQSEEVVSQWKVRCDELEEAVNELEDELEQQQEEANEAISKWESRCSTLEEKSMQLEHDAEDSTVSYAKRIQQLESDLNAELSTKEEAQSKLATETQKTASLEELVTSLMAERSKGEAELSTELECIRSNKAEIEKKLEDETKLHNTREAELNVERESHKTDRVSFQRERKELKALVFQLEEELIEANSTLQSCVTDEVTQKATETVMETLRIELDKMRQQMDAQRSAFEGERRVRLSLEEEAEQLKSDLSVLLPTISRADSKKFTFKAAEKVQRMERKEIEELRKALEKALQEVASARAAEKEVAERAASSRLQASVCEQEVIAAKADVKFLTETMDEMREAEATRRATLEYRISALEDDRAVLTRFHADELDSLRNELEHLMVEKDRLLMSLRDSERSNASLNKLMAKEKKSNEEESSIEAFARLRLEKVQLLASAEEDASKMERRMKEAVAAEVSSIEKEATSERELRIAAEATAEDLREELEEYHERMAESAGGSGDALSSADSVAFEKLKKESKKLKEGNSSIQNQLAQMEIVSSQAKASISELTEKYRKCQAKLHKVEREGLFDAEVTAEIARLRANAVRQSPHSKSNKENQNDAWLVVSNDPVEDDDDKKNTTPLNENMSATEAYGYILKQKLAIKEERSMFDDILSEHDDLLALLAQQDLEKASLVAALEDAAGENAVDEAIFKAQQTAVKEFGKYVKLNQVEKID